MFQQSRKHYKSLPVCMYTKKPQCMWELWGRTHGMLTPTSTPRCRERWRTKPRRLMLKRLCHFWWTTHLIFFLCRHGDKLQIRERAIYSVPLSSSLFHVILYPTMTKIWTKFLPPSVLLSQHWGEGEDDMNLYHKELGQSPIIHSGARWSRGWRRSCFSSFWMILIV